MATTGKNVRRKTIFGYVCMSTGETERQDGTAEFEIENK